MAWMAAPGFDASAPLEEEVELALAVHAVLPGMMSPPPHAFTDAELARIAATPTVLVLPDHERATDPAVAAARARRAGAAVARVAGAGHLMSLEQPAALAAAIGEALAEP